MDDTVLAPESRKAVVPFAAGLALISAGSASAQIVYSGIKDINFTSSSNLSVDLNGDSTPDIQLNFTTVNGTSKPAVGTLSTTEVATVSMGPLGTGLSDYTQGESIQDMGFVNFNQTAEASFTYTQGYAGFTINPNATAQPLYGWAQFEYSGNVATLVDWAYNTTPGADIEAGQMSAVPEPADTALMMGGAALLAGSVALWRKREGAPAAA